MKWIARSPKNNQQGYIIFLSFIMLLICGLVILNLWQLTMTESHLQKAFIERILEQQYMNLIIKKIRHDWQKQQKNCFWNSKILEEWPCQRQHHWRKPISHSVIVRYRILEAMSEDSSDSTGIEIKRWLVELALYANVTNQKNQIAQMKVACQIATQRKKILFFVCHTQDT